MPIPALIGIIAGSVLAFIFLLLGKIKELETRNKRFLIHTSAVDPFTGTWREKGELANRRLTIAPTGNGLSFQRFIDEEPFLIGYGKDFEDEYPFIDRMYDEPVPIATVLRIDDRTLEFSYKHNGEIILKCTYAASSDGRQLEASWEYTIGGKNRPALYDRVGSVPEGDTFFGTWQPHSDWADVTIIIRGKTIDWYAGDLHVVKGKFDGKKYRGDNYSSKNATYRFRRLNYHTIEIAIDAEQFVSCGVWQLQGSALTLTSTYTPKGNQNSGVPRFSAEKYERIS